MSEMEYKGNVVMSESEFIDEIHLNVLREAGLHVSSPKALLGGEWRWVTKPVSTSGNNLPGYESGYVSLGDEPQCPDTDAPMLKLGYDGKRWEVEGINCAGGMGPGDFVTYWGNPEDALDDILDFFFGDSRRMNRKHRK